MRFPVNCKSFGFKLFAYVKTNTSVGQNTTFNTFTTDRRN